jgi:hypothetical protein
MVCPFCRLETRQPQVTHADCTNALKRADDDLYARVERIKLLMEELTRTPRTSPSHRAVLEDIYAETAAYVAAVDAARGVDAKRIVQTEGARGHTLDRDLERWPDSVARVRVN